MTNHLIYIADDETDLRNLLQEVLETDGFEVETAANGEQLLALVEKRRPDLVLLDIAMPGLSGWEVQQRLKDQPAMADVPVVAITAQGGESVEASARNALGFHDFLQKPFRMDDLLERTRAALETDAGR